ncbi:uncharacterized protein LOC106050842 isoform X3 [Biomphalaria glabrata]|uniref:Uncharacterized protein LOC106050842 isoform X3 n=1 Tax=Biomphalaria glabrata TaxID=6526 RepID=A0A9W2YZ48_BIOGL|nr:uncharacterized protein LOC106050842 isoform X3 [Biomphalaria glabrata]
MTLVVLVSLCAVLTLSYANPLNHHNCKINGKTYKNGVIIRVPEIYCNTYKCVDGYPSLLEKGCDWEGECIPVKGTLVKNCKTYTCSKSTEGSSISLLEIEQRIKLLGRVCCWKLRSRLLCCLKTVIGTWSEAGKAVVGLYSRFGRERSCRIRNKTF